MTKDMSGTIWCLIRTLIVHLVITEWEEFQLLAAFPIYGYHIKLLFDKNTEVTIIILLGYPSDQLTLKTTYSKVTVAVVILLQL